MGCFGILHIIFIVTPELHILRNRPLSFHHSHIHQSSPQTMVLGFMTMTDLGATLGVPSGPVVATGTVCHSVSRWSSSSGIVTMSDHIPERMSTGHDKRWERCYGY